MADGGHGEGEPLVGREVEARDAELEHHIHRQSGIHGVHPVVVRHLDWAGIAIQHTIDEARAGAGPFAQEGALGDMLVPHHDDSPHCCAPLGVAELERVEVPVVERPPGDVRVAELLLDGPHGWQVRHGRYVLGLHVLVPVLVPVVWDRVALEHLGVRLPQALHGLAVERRLLHRDLAERRELLEHAVEELRLRTEPTATGFGILVLVLRLLPPLLHRRDGGKNLGGYLLDVLKQLLQRR
mmetsp:Transcript_21785/g.57571  ORF Transcript_21785/g.57571 Transcript_21785/m.57571 type:complete len:240 (-) Transcript_21785:756-1475(-)